MYPYLANNMMLLRQYDSSVLYPLNFGSNNQIVSSTYEFEKINKTASEILELCDGTRTINDIAADLAKKYNESYAKAFTLVNSFISLSQQKGVVQLLNDKGNGKINVSGSYDTIYPFNVQFELTKRCQLRCLHCFNDSGVSRTNEMDTRQVKQVINKLEEMGVKKVMLTGGEPSIRSDLGEIVSYASEKFVGISVASNGYGFNKHLFNQLGPLKNVVVQISVDGTRENHNAIRGVNDSYDKAISAIKGLVTSGVSTIVASTFNDMNYMDMESITKIVKELGARQITYSATLSIGRAKDHNINEKISPPLLMEQGLRIKEKYSDAGFFVNINDVSNEGVKQKITTCGRGDTQICVRENGDVSPCLQFGFVYGNLLRQHPCDIFNYNRVLKMRGHKEPDATTCQDCSEKYSCSGCVGVAYGLPDSACKWKQLHPEFMNQLQSIRYQE